MSDAPGMEGVRKAILDVPDFPKEGVVFKDITPVLRDHALFESVVDAFAERFAAAGAEEIAGIESRGFILGSAVAQKMGLGLVLLRKPGKLPREVVEESYDLEYGKDALQLHADSFVGGTKVGLIDDVLATGGTAAAAVRLIEKAGGELVSAGFLMELTFLEGGAKLGGAPYFSLLGY